VVGSANLTSGLVANIETALVVTGQPGDAPLEECWRYAELLWRHPAATDWRQLDAPVPDGQLDPALLGMLRRAVPVGSVLPTLDRGKPNQVTDITAAGVYVQTQRSRSRGTGAQLVPAWMVQLAWDYLQLHGTLANKYLLAGDGLNVKRSSAVCALLARLPAIDVAGTHPIVLRLRR